MILKVINVRKERKNTQNTGIIHALLPNDLILTKMMNDVII